MLISMFHRKTGTIITTLLLYYMYLGLESTKIHQFVQHTPKRSLNSFVQSVLMLEDKEMKIPTQA